ncbi:MAG: hypothetical protein U9N14_04100, partial [Pseudomonadota bacterium]|nr:hypothetical protein [Pseudomonadota bacterium]
MADFFATTGFWVLVPTLIFALALWKPAKKATLGRLDAYADKVRGELEETHRLRDEAQALHARFQRDLREARQHTDSIRENADKQAVRFK